MHYRRHQTQNQNQMAHTLRHHFVMFLLCILMQELSFKYDLDKDTKDGLICLPTDSNDDQNSIH